MIRDKISKIIDDNRGAIARYCDDDFIDEIIKVKWDWIDIRQGMPDKSESLKQYLCDDGGLYSVCTVEFDEEANRAYFRDNDCLEVVPCRYKLIEF